MLVNRSLNWPLSIVQILFFLCIFTGSFSYIFHLSFEHILGLADAATATLYVTVLMAITFIAAVVIAAIFPGRLFSHNIGTPPAHVLFENKLDELALDEDDPLNDIAIKPTSQIPSTLIDSFNGFLGRVRMRIARLDRRMSANLRKHRETRADDSKRESERASVIGDLSQQLQSPLSSVISAIELARSEIGPPASHNEKLRSYLSTAYRYAIRLSENARALITYSTTDLRLPAREVEFDIKELIRECVDATQASTDASANTVNCSHSGPGRVVADRMRLKQLLENLLTNAHKTCNEGFVSVVSIAMDELLILSVRDTGDNPPVDDPARQSRGRADRAAAPELILCKNLAASLSGSIDVTTDQTRPTTVQLTVPISVVT